MTRSFVGGPMDGATLSDYDINTHQAAFGYAGSEAEPLTYRRAVIFRNAHIPFRDGVFRYSHWDWCLLGEVGCLLPEYQLYQGRMVFTRYVCP